MLAAPCLAAPAPVDFEKGARCLFIGHSFFIPVAANFNAIATTNGFTEHEMSAVFRGSVAGAPGAMWDDPATRAEVEAQLATGQIELFGLTSFGALSSSFDDYARWFDLALQYNPDTRFFIGIPWKSNGPSSSADAFEDAIETTAYDQFVVTAQLRSAYPQSTVEYLAYGKTSAVMRNMFDAGTLPDITELVGQGPEALFADGFTGHAGPMMLELCALSWMEHLYGAAPETLASTPWTSDVLAILREVAEFNAPFQELEEHGDVFCLSSTHSGGVRASLTGLGSVRISDNAFRVAVSGAPAETFGLFVLGSAAIDQPLGDGRLCVGGNVTRLNPASSTDVAGNLVREIDLVGPYGAAVQPGLPGVHFQFWFRDVPAGGSGFNLSNGLRVEFTP
ncbi:MAG: hypothetical protein AAFZ87_06970 [Planctomycetota bacterium]